MPVLVICPRDYNDTTPRGVPNSKLGRKIKFSKSGVHGLVR